MRWVLAILAARLLSGAQAFCVRPATRSTTALCSDVSTKRGGDAVMLTGLTVYQQAIAATPTLLSPVTIDLGGAVIRGCRITLCLFVAEKTFKLLRAPESQREVPVPVEAAAACLVLNLLCEYVISAQGYIPSALAHSLGGTPADVATAYLSIIAWRIAYASLFPPGR